MEASFVDTGVSLGDITILRRSLGRIHSSYVYFDALSFFVHREGKNTSLSCSCIFNGLMKTLNGLKFQNQA